MNKNYGNSMKQELIILIESNAMSTHGSHQYRYSGYIEC